jgi:hypothetical protein
MSGPIPMRRSSAMPSGTLTRLKYGVPTLIFVPRIASVSSGKMVPGTR